MKPEIDDIEEDVDDPVIDDCVYCGDKASHSITFKGKRIKGMRYVCREHLDQGKVPPWGFTFVSVEKV